jgi:hypothetical protein
MATVFEAGFAFHQTKWPAFMWNLAGAFLIFVMAMGAFWVR